MIKKCFCCLAEKDLSVETIYPYEEDNICTDSTVPQLFVIDCESTSSQPKEFRVVVLCHACWHKLEQEGGGIDMWISQGQIESINCITPYNRFPKADLTPEQGMWEAENYTIL